MKLRLHPVYKTTLLLAIVVGPLYWLTLTEDGQLRTDAVLLNLLGKPEINLTIEGLHSDLTEAQLRGLFPDLALACEIVETSFGNRACRAEIDLFNTLPARSFTLYLLGDQLRAVRIDYRSRSHTALVDQLRYRLGRDGQPDPDHPDTLTWMVADGLILMPVKRPVDDKDAALFWLSRAVLASPRDS